jgi:mRNA interferase MazF
MDMVKRFEVYLVNLDPTVGAEIQKTRPCVIISPDEMNVSLRTVIVAPLTSTRKTYACRVNTEFLNTLGQVALDQIRSVDKSRLVKRLGALSKQEAQETCAVLVEMFGE